MTVTIQANDKEYNAFRWFEAPLPKHGETAGLPHTRNHDLREQGITELRPGEVSFQCDQSLVFDTVFSLKGDGRKFVVLSSEGGKHIAKPY